MTVRGGGEIRLRAVEEVVGALGLAGAVYEPGAAYPVKGLERVEPTELAVEQHTDEP